MKVLLVNQIPEVNNKYTFSLAGALINNGVDVTVCGIEDDNVTAYKDVPFIGLFGAYSKEKGPINKVLSYRNSWERVLKYCRLRKIDIVHVQWYIFSPMDWYYHKQLRKNKIHVITTIHDLLPFNKKIYDFHYHKKIYSSADKVISQARMNLPELKEKFGVPENKIEYIPHGHYMEFAEEVSREESIKKLGLPNDKTIILFFGQIKKVKGVDILIRAIKKVSESNPNILCVIAGKVWKDDFSIYQDLIDSLELNSKVRCDIRFIDDEEIKYYFNAADIVALPYRQIYQSGVALLGIAYEKPIVATTEGEFLTVIQNNKTGILVPSENPDLFADALLWYINNPDKAREYAVACKKDIEQRLSWKNISALVKKVYEEVMV